MWAHRRRVDALHEATHAQLRNHLAVLPHEALIEHLAQLLVGLERGRHEGLLVERQPEAPLDVGSGGRALAPVSAPHQIGHPAHLGDEDQARML
jgi:hypothetical protein